MSTELVVEGVHLLHKQEGQDRVRSQTEKVGCESLPQTEKALLCDGFPPHVHHALVGHVATGHLVHVLQTSLGHVDRQGDHRREKTGNETGSKVAEDSIHKVGCGEHPLLHLRVAGQLGAVQCHGSGNSRTGTTPERENTLFARDASDGIQTVRVITTLGCRESSISSHANQCHLSRVAHHGTDTTSSHTCKGLLVEGKRRSILSLEGLHQSGIHTQTSGRVRSLAKQSRRETGVQTKSSFLANDVRNRRKRSTMSSRCTTFAAELHASLDQIDGLHNAGSHHARRATEQEVQPLGVLFV
mmetsp:Transcript_28098/g.70569  ORF Transcript_28098/g.70569 Transcript_28098/m.70569 type:complete len:300 (+) Transcript_28098:64-963(+)